MWAGGGGGGWRLRSKNFIALPTAQGEDARVRAPLARWHFKSEACDHAGVRPGLIFEGFGI